MKNLENNLGEIIGTTKGVCYTCKLNQIHNDFRVIDIFPHKVVFKSGRVTYRTRIKVSCIRCKLERIYKQPFHFLKSKGICECNQILPGFKKKQYATLVSHYNGIRSRAKTADIHFELTVENVAKYSIKNCVYCNEAPSIKTIFNKNVSSYGIALHGLDRIDSSKGYTDNNVQPCCKHCNWAKNSQTEYDFLKHITKIAKFRNLIDE